MPLCGPLMKCLKKEIYRNESNFITGCESSWEKGEIVNVSDGYARNAILPKKLGVEATTKNLNDLKLQNQHADKVAAENLEHAKELAEEIGTKKVVVKIKSGEGGRISVLFPPRKLHRLQKSRQGWIWIKRRCSWANPSRLLELMRFR